MQRLCVRLGGEEGIRKRAMDIAVVVFLRWREVCMFGSFIVCLVKLQQCFLTIDYRGLTSAC